MQQSDFARRTNTIPFRANYWSNYLIGNRPLGPDQQWDGDLAFLSPDTSGFSPTISAGIHAVRFAHPEQAEVITAFLSMTINASSAAGFSFKLGIGSFDTDGLTPLTNQTQAQIDADHLALTGSTSPFSVAAGAQLLLEGISLTPRLKKRGATGYSPDGFVLLMQFLSSPDRQFANGYRLAKFRIDGTCQMGIL